ncbi:MAG: hypothetical protein L6R42_003672 [Xanthoria sp. 1 TBL-2021]|nr:MAG: hypothetical protein L6R42_003672 [Xanthoria sp. 1 TBL-2021]
MPSQPPSLEPPQPAEAEKNGPDGGSHDGEDYSIFSAGMRTYLTYQLGFIIILSTLTATAYLPLIPLLSTHFSVSIQAINLTVTAYAICQALSPALFASLADAFGRRPVLLGLIGLYASASLGLTLNQRSFAALLAFRVLQSIGGSSTVPIAYGIVADVAVVSERGKMLGPMLSMCNAISAVGPVSAGAIALRTSGYSWIFLALLIIAVICLLLVGFTLPETARNIVGNGMKPVHGVWRTWWSFFRGKEQLRRSERRADDATEERLQMDGKPAWRPLSAFVSLRILLYPDAAAVLCMVASSYSVYYTFQVAIPVIFDEVYGYNELEIGLAFLPGLAGMTIGGITAGKLVDRNYANTARKCNIDVDRKKGDDLKDFPIENARYRNCLPFLSLEVALVIGYGWVVQSHIHPSVPLIMQFFICAISTLLSHTSSALLVDIFPAMSSSAYASGQITRCTLSAASAAILQPLVDAVGRGWYFTIFALFIGISGLGSVVTSRSKGVQWRQKRQATPHGNVTDAEQIPQQLLTPPADETGDSSNATPKKETLSSGV